MRMIHVTYPGEWVCIVRGGGREGEHALSHSTHTYTHIYTYTRVRCVRGGGEGGGRWCCITWEWVGNAALIHVWSHQVIYMNVFVSSWTSASRNRHDPTRKMIWSHCHQQQNNRPLGMYMNGSVSFRAGSDSISFPMRQSYYVPIYMYMCPYIYVYVPIYIYIRAHIYMYMCSYIYIYVHSGHVYEWIGELF